MASPWEQIYKLNALNPDAFPVDAGGFSSWNPGDGVTPVAPESQVAPISGERQPASGGRYNYGITAQDLLQSKSRAPASGGAGNSDVMKQLMDVLEEQKTGVGNQEEILKSYLGNSPQLDLSPLMALTDSLVKGSKLSQGYKRPDGMAEQIATTAKLQDGVSDQRKSIMDTLSRVAGQKSNDRFQENYLRQLQREKSMDLKTREGLFKGFQTDKLANTAKEALAGADSAIALLDSNTAVGDKAFSVQLARAAGEKGPLSNTDIATWAGSPAVAQTVQRTLEKWDSGRLDEIDRKDMYKVIEALRRRQRGLLDSRVNHFSKKVAPNVYGIGEEDARMILQDEDQVPVSLPKPPEPGAAPKEEKAGKLTERQMEIKRLREELKAGGE